MITEIAVFTALPTKEDELGQAMIHGVEFIRQHPECISAQLTRCIEKPERYMLTIGWTSLEAHLEDFRNGPLFIQWRKSIAGLFEDKTELYHYQTF